MDGIKDKVEKMAGAFCLGYAAGKGAAYGWKAGMSENNGPHSPFNNFSIVLIKSFSLSRKVIKVFLYSIIACIFGFIFLI